MQIAAGEIVARVREEVPAANGATGRVEIEVCREEGGYSVQLRDISPPGIQGVRLPTVQVDDCGRLALATDDLTSVLSAEVEKEPQAGEAGFIRVHEDKARLGVCLSYTLLSPEGRHLRCKRLPLLLPRQELTLRQQAVDERQLELGSLEWLSEPPQELMDEDCILRLRVDVPIPFGTEPLLVEVYRHAENAFTLVTRDVSASGSAPYSIARITSTIEGESTPTEQQNLLAPLSPTESAAPSDSSPVIARIPNIAYADKRGLGRFQIHGTIQPCFGSVPSPPIHISLTLADEWGNRIATIPLEIAQEPYPSPLSPTP